MDGRLDGRSDGKSAHSTGLCPISGPLPRYTPTSTQKLYKAGQGYRWPYDASWRLVSPELALFSPELALLSPELALLSSDSDELSPLGVLGVLLGTPRSPSEIWESMRDLRYRTGQLWVRLVEKNSTFLYHFWNWTALFYPQIMTKPKRIKIWDFIFLFRTTPPFIMVESDFFSR